MRSKKLSKYAKSISLKQFYKIASFDIWSGLGRCPPVATVREHVHPWHKI